MGRAAGAEKAAAARLGIDLVEYRRRRAAGEKWCTCCRRWHRLEAFGLDRSRTDGRAPACLASRIVATNSPGRRERRTMGAMGLAWCRGCSWWLPLAEVDGGVCRPHLRAEERARYRANPRRGRSSLRRRGEPEIPSWWRAEVLALGCAYCGAPATTIDHVVPLANGGWTAPGNLVPACLSCNASKKDRDPRPWVDRITNFEVYELLIEGPVSRTVVAFDVID